MSKINIVVRLQHWMDSVPGQTFLNYAYSWGASIVILGALFKLTHLPGGNFMLFIGMGTEVVVFFLSAFDRPFDKEEIGKELPHDYQTDEEIAESLGLNDDDEVDDEAEDTENTENETHTTPAAQPAVSAASAQPVAPLSQELLRSPLLHNRLQLPHKKTLLPCRRLLLPNLLQLLFLLPNSKLKPLLPLLLLLVQYPSMLKQNVWQR